MSVVANVLVFVDFAMPEQYEKLKGEPWYFRDIADFAPRRVMDADDPTVIREVRPADLWGGNKLPEIELWAAAINHLDEKALLDWLRAWYAELSPSISPVLQVFIKDEYAEEFRVHEIRR